MLSEYYEHMIDDFQRPRWSIVYHLDLHPLYKRAFPELLLLQLIVTSNWVCHFLICDPDVVSQVKLWGVLIFYSSSSKWPRFRLEDCCHFSGRGVVLQSLSEWQRSVESRESRNQDTWVDRRETKYSGSVLWSHTCDKNTSLYWIKWTW